MPNLSDGQKATITRITGSNPYVAAARIGLNGIVSPMTRSDDSTAQGIEGINQGNAQQGMQMESAPNAPAKGQGFMNEINDSLLPGSERLFGRGIQATPSIAGGYSIQPTDVDSSKQAFANSNLQNYMNYMNYRGGY